jgi:hypothetical protein
MAGNICYTKFRAYLSPRPAQSHGVFREARRPLMERQMFLVSADGEVFGSDILNLAVVAGALGLLLATLWTAASPDLPVAQGPSAQQVAVVAHPGHIS